MPRPNLSTAMLNALNAAELRPAFFIELNFSSGPVYLWTGSQSTVWNGQTWLGAGKVVSISAIEDGSQVMARGIQLGFSGFDAALLPDALADYQLGLPAMVYLGLLSGGSLIASPATSWAGRMDQPVVDIDGGTARLTIACESRLVDLNVACGRRYTPEDQQRDWPGDLGMMFVPSIQEITTYWGTAPISSGTL